MRVSVSTCLLALAHLRTTLALNGALLRQIGELADQGLLPDGTPMAPVTSPDTSDTSSLMAIASTNDDLSSASLLSSPPSDDDDLPIRPEYVELPLDNFASDGDYSYYGTFFNRYWVNSRFYKPGGPVFLYDFGEADAGTGAQMRLRNGSGFFREMVERYQGVGIVWEHRFYGNSTPEPINTNTPPEAFRFLTTSQALADVDRFAWQFSRPEIPHDLTPKSTPWIFIGGSYPGMRAAFMRDKYPSTIFAGYASSAPTQAHIDMSSYFEVIWDGLQNAGFGNCTRDLQAVVRWVDGMLERNETAAEVKEMFLGKGASGNSNGGFADALTVVFAVWQSYGVEGGWYSLRGLCDHMGTDPDAKGRDGERGVVSGREGWARRKGAEWSARRWASWRGWVDMVNMYMGTECSGEAEVEGKCELDRPFADPSMIAWTWQYCTEWGYLQSANLGPKQLLSKHNSLFHQREICHRQFPAALPEWPLVTRTNQRFGGWDLRPANVYWTGGEYDPWRTLSPLSNGVRVKMTTRAPKCNEEPKRGEVFGYLLPGAMHCFDFRAKDVWPGAVRARAYFTDALDEWLKCWRPGRGRGRGGRG
ncbi:hypothetical protein M011DRAFT_493800 [Sporormia fimetaria CBS 119925]|uniref:Peptidase S28 n=1 Tax=Sporormia fimetaria CBS 119925 TaxID=1340428 RepID=A0A6A6VD41_9PLEO|nr:hypothetical protein M011DRAFT_493800 [Sporormia fimetaria CBS 119925]